MKKCPTCEKTFEDSMRFCQVDGTPLADDAPAFDPYATIVARPEAPVSVEPAAPELPADPVFEVPSEVVTEVSVSPIAEPEEVLDLPQSDPLKTMYVSEDEMRKALGNVDETEDPVMEIPPLAEPAPPTFAEPEIPSPIFSDLTPQASPFAVTETTVEAEPVSDTFDPPIPAPFETPASPAFDPQPAEDEAATVLQTEPPSFSVPEPPPSPFQPAEPPPSPFQVADPPPSPFQAADPAPFQTPEPVFSPDPVPPPFKEPDIFSAPSEWSPPPAPVASWENQEIGQNTPFQPPTVPADGANKTLPIVSLVLGIISLCCYISPLTGLIALITGYLGMKNVNNDPNTYGGKGLAIAGMITGGVFFLVGVLYWIYIIFIVGLAALGSFAR